VSVTTTRVFASILERQQPWQRLGTSTLFVSGLYVLMLTGALLARSPTSSPKRKVGKELVVTLLELPKLSELRNVQNEGGGATGAAQAAVVTVPVSRRGSARGLGHLPLATVRANVPSDTAAAPSAERAPTREATSVKIETASASSMPAPQSSVGASTATAGTATSAGSGGASANATHAGTGSAAASGVRSGSGASDSSVLPFTDGMTRPALLSKVDPSYTREARDAQVAGLILTKCVITTEGRLVRCRIVKGIPLMDQAVLTALAQWRYSPVLYQGKPVAVDYVIPVRLVLP